MKAKKSQARRTVTGRPGENPATPGQSRRQRTETRGGSERRREEAEPDQERQRETPKETEAERTPKSWSWRLRQRHGEVETRGAGQGRARTPGRRPQNREEGGARGDGAGRGPRGRRPPAGPRATPSPRGPVPLGRRLTTPSRHLNDTASIAPPALGRGTQCPSARRRSALLRAPPRCLLALLAQAGRSLLRPPRLLK